MLNSKLHDYLSKMSVYELNRFGKYISSPLFNEDEKLTRFAAFLLPLAKQKAWQEADERKMWKHVFGSKRFAKAKHTRLLSDTVKKLEHFLVLDRFQQQQKTEQHIMLLEVMNERQLFKHFPEQLSLTQRRHHNQPTRDFNFYHLQFLLEQQHNFFLEAKGLRSTEKNLQQAIHSLDVYYFLHKLRYACVLFHYQQFLSMEGELLLLREILALLAERKEWGEIPAVDIYYHILLSMTEPENEQHFMRVKTQIQKHEAQFPIAVVKDMFVFAMNYCINRINLGHTDYLHEIFGLYQFALKKDLLLDSDELSPWDYKNIVTTALRVKQAKWAQQFIRDYKNKLPKTERENAYTFNLARYHFYARDFDRVLQLLQSVEYNDLFYQLDSKTTLMKTFYELGNYSSMLALKDSFRVLLRRKKSVSEATRLNYLHFIQLATKLMRTDIRDPKRMLALKKLIEQTQNVADKSWLLEKADELLS